MLRHDHVRHVGHLDEEFGVRGRESDLDGVVVRSLDAGQLVRLAGDVRGALDLAPDRLETLVGLGILREERRAVDDILGGERHAVMPLDAGVQVERIGGRVC